MKRSVLVCLVGLCVLGVFAACVASEDAAAQATEPKIEGDMDPAAKAELLEKIKRAYAEELEKKGDIEVEGEDDAAAEKQEQPHRQPRPSQNAVAYSLDARVSAVFVGHPNRVFPAGEEVEMVIGLANDGAKPFTAQMIFNTIYHPQDYRYFIQNFTARRMNVVVEAGEEASFNYKFKPSAELDPRGYKLLSLLFYRDDIRNFTSIVYNDTITISEPLNDAHVQFIFTVSLIAATVGVAVFVAYRLKLRIAARKGKGSYSVASRPANVDPSKNEWLAGTAAAKSIKKSKK